MITAQLIPILYLLLLSSEPVLPVYDGCYQESENVILYSLDFYEQPETKICGQWYMNDEPAKAPYSDIEQSYYCRTTDEFGYTFFAYRLVGEYTCEEAYNMLEFVTFSM